MGGPLEKSEPSGVAQERILAPKKEKWQTLSVK
jgi:hypothetical protein